MTDSTSRRMELAQSLMTKAGELALAAFRDPLLHVESKGPGDVVSETDFAIERMAHEAVAAAFPEDGFVGEEFGGGPLAIGFTWVIDPIDGTVNFARKLAYFCVALALLKDGRPVAAWTLDPLLDELFHAGPDRIARLNGQPIHCATPASFGDAVIGLGFSPRHDVALGGDIVHALTGGIVHERYADPVAVARSANLDELCIDLSVFDPADAAALHDAGISIRCHAYSPQVLGRVEKAGLGWTAALAEYLRAGLIDTVSGDDVAWLQRFAAEHKVAIG